MHLLLSLSLLIWLSPFLLCRPSLIGNIPPQLLSSHSCLWIDCNWVQCCWALPVPCGGHTLFYAFLKSWSCSRQALISLIPCSKAHSFPCHSCHHLVSAHCEANGSSGSKLLNSWNSLVYGCSPLSTLQRVMTGICSMTYRMVLDASFASEHSVEHDDWNMFYELEMVLDTSFDSCPWLGYGLHPSSCCDARTTMLKWP